MQIIYLFFIIFFFLFSCRESKKKDVESRNSEVSLIVSAHKQIKGTQIFVDVILEPARIQIGENLLYVSCFRCDTMIYTFSLPDFKLLSSFGGRNNGPEGFQFPTFTNAKKNNVGLWGYADLKKIKQFRVDKTGLWSFVEEYNLTEYKAYNQLFAINDSLAYYNNHPPLLTLKRVDLKAGGNEKEHVFEMDQSRGNAFFMSNKGDLSVSAHSVAYLYYYKNRIDFFDLDFNLIKSYKGTNRKVSVDTQDMRESIVYYIGSFAGEQFLYAINHSQAFKYKKEQACTLEVFTWNGELVSTVELSPAVDIFVVDEGNQLLYGYNYNQPDYFFQYDIKPDS